MALNTDIRLRRRAILTGLRPFLEDEELQAALALWQQEYAGQPVFALSGLVAQCCTRPELKRQRSQMLRALIAALELPSDQLLPDSDLQADAAAMTAQPAKAQLAGADDKTRLFMQLIANIQASCEPDLRAIMRLRLQAALETLGLERQQKHAMWTWLAEQGAALESEGLGQKVTLGQNVALGQSYALKSLQALINQAYIVMCEQLGPVKADQHLSRAVHATQAKMPVAGFSVHDLL